MFFHNLFARFGIDLACHSLLPSICKCCVVTSITSRALSVHCTLSFWKFRLARLRAHFFCLNERGAGPAGRDDVIRIMFRAPFFSLVLLAKEGRKEVHTRTLPVQIYALQFAPGTNPTILTAAKNPADAADEADANEPRTSVVGSRHSLIVRPSVRASTATGRWSGSRQPSLHSNVVLYAVRQGDERGDGREGGSKGRGKGSEGGSGQARQKREGRKEGVRLEIG